MHLASYTKHYANNILTFVSEYSGNLYSVDRFRAWHVGTSFHARNTGTKSLRGSYRNDIKKSGS